MKTEEARNINQPEPVQRDSETPLPQKPSVLFILSLALGVSTIVLLVVSAYHGVVGL